MPDDNNTFQAFWIFGREGYDKLTFGIVLYGCWNMINWQRTGLVPVLPKVEHPTRSEKDHKYFNTAIIVKLFKDVQLHYSQVLKAAIAASWY